MNYMRGLTDLKGQRWQHYELADQKDIKGEKEIWVVVVAEQETTTLFFVLTKADTFLSSRSVWNRAGLGSGPGMIEMAISWQGPTQLAYCLCLTKAGISLKFFCNV